MNNIGIDYLAIARQYGINDDKKAKTIFTQALDTTKKLVGDVPQNTLEREFPKELMDNYQDLLQMQTDHNYKEDFKKRENEKLMRKNRTKIREFLDDDMELDDLIDEYNLEEEGENSYSQSMINPNTTSYHKRKGKEEGCNKSKQREYAIEGKGPNTGDLDGENGYGSDYYEPGENAYGTNHSSIELIDAKTAYEDQDTLNNGENE